MGFPKLGLGRSYIWGLNRDVDQVGWFQVDYDGRIEGDQLLLDVALDTLVD